MNCQSCGGKGMIRLNWSDAPHEFAICLCDAGRWYRSDVNAGRHTGVYGWQVWCAREQVDPELVWFIEDVLTDAELRERGFAKPKAATVGTVGSREAALLAAGRMRKAKL